MAAKEEKDDQLPIEAEVNDEVGEEPIHDDALAAIEKATLERELIEGRISTYGDPVVGMTRIAQIWSGILGIEIQPAEIPLMLIGMKLVRAQESPDYSDNSDDIDGYLSIFRGVVGEDMIHARNAADYQRQLAEREGS